MFLALSLHSSVHLAHSHSGDLPTWLLLSGPIVAIIFYSVVYRRYRNQNRSYEFERTTLIQRTADVTGNEQKVTEVTGTRDPEIAGNNIDNDRLRVAFLPPPGESAQR